VQYFFEEGTEHRKSAAPLFRRRLHLPCYAILIHLQSFKIIKQFGILQIYFTLSGAVSRFAGISLKSVNYFWGHMKDANNF